MNVMDPIRYKGYTITQYGERFIVRDRHNTSIIDTHSVRSAKVMITRRIRRTTPPWLAMTTGIIKEPEPRKISMLAFVMSIKECENDNEGQE